MPNSPTLPVPRRILIAGANGYIGSRLAGQLLNRGHSVTAFVRSEAARVPTGCAIVTGDALDDVSYTAAARGSDTLVHLVGVAHPSPSKAALFETIDLASARCAARAALSVQLRHIVFISVAQPAPAMHAYVDARRRAEEAFTASSIPCTFLRPWYVIGPGHYWPLTLLPLYKLLEYIPPTRSTALRCGLVGIKTILRCLTRAIENPSQTNRAWDVPTLRSLSRHPYSP